MKAFWLSLMAVALAASVDNAFSATPNEAAAVARAVNTVTNAVQFFKDNGRANALAEFNNPKGRFNYVEMYIFAYNTNGTMIANCRNKNLVGMQLINLPDADGKLYVKAIVDMAKARGKGAVDYSYENPDTDGVESRRVYFQRVDDVIICCVIPKVSK
jgi:cytochrome c